MTNTESNRSDKNGKLKHSISISSIKTPLSNTATMTTPKRSELDM